MLVTDVMGANESNYGDKQEPNTGSEHRNTGELRIYFNIKVLQNTVQEL